MLFISRSINEAILIGNNLEIKVALIDEDYIYLAIKTVKEIGINRQEVVTESRKREREIISLENKLRKINLKRG